jgi:hypothetical protein
MPKISLVRDKPLPYHSDFTRDKAERAFFELSFTGGTRYKTGIDASGEDVFIDHEQESKECAKRRKRLSVYRNYCKPIVNRYNNFIFQNSIRRDMDPIFKEWCKDVDLLGNSLHEFMKKQILQAQKFGRSFMMVETTKTSDYQTVAQAQAAGNRVFVIDIHPDRIVNWYNLNGVYTEILILDPETNKLCLYDAVNYQEAKLNEKGKVVSIEAPKPHGFGALPVICVKAVDDGLSQLRDIAEINKSLFFLDSLLREELSKQTFTQAFLLDYDPDDEKRQPKAIGIGSRKYVCIPPDIDGKGATKLEKMSADSSQAQSISDAIKSDVQEIYRLAGLYDFGSSALGDRASGNSLQIKFNEISLMAASICQQAEKAENHVIDFYNRLSSSTVKHSDYPDSDELDAESLTNELKITLDIIGSTLPIVLKNEQVRTFAQVCFPHLAPEKQMALERELQETEADDQDDSTKDEKGPPAMEDAGNADEKDRDNPEPPVPADNSK